MECQQQLIDGIDPSQFRKEKKQKIRQAIEDEQRLAGGIPLENSFADVSQRWLEDYKPTVVSGTIDRPTRHKKAREIALPGVRQTIFNSEKLKPKKIR